MNNHKENEESAFDISLQNIRARSYLLAREIEKESLISSLRECVGLLSELDTNQFTVDEYMTLYTMVFDEMHFIKKFIKDQSHKENKLEDLYTIVQQVTTLVPRLYLMITIGNLALEENYSLAKKVIADILKFMLCCKSPVKGLLVRYYFTKTLKDYFCNYLVDSETIESDNNTITTNNDISDTPSFNNMIFIIEVLLHNLEQSCNLWIKVENLDDKNNLKHTLGENVFRLANIETLTSEVYSGFILSKLLDIVLSKKDIYLKSYLLDCIIHAFPTELNLKCVSSIFSGISNLKGKININSFVISFIQRVEQVYIKLSSYNTSNTSNKNNDDNDSRITDTNFNDFQLALDNFISMSDSNKEKNFEDIIKSLDLYASIIRCFLTTKKETIKEGMKEKYSTTNKVNINSKESPDSLVKIDTNTDSKNNTNQEKDKLSYIDFIIKCYKKIEMILINNKEKITDKDNKKKINNKLFMVLSYLFEYEIEIDKIPSYIKLIKYLSEENYNEIVINYFNQITKSDSLKFIKDTETLDFIINLAEPMLLKIKNNKKLKLSYYQETALSKIFYLIDLNEIDLDFGLTLTKKYYYFLSEYQVNSFSVYNAFVNHLVKHCLYLSGYNNPYINWNKNNSNNAIFSYKRKISKGYKRNYDSSIIKRVNLINNSNKDSNDTFITKCYDICKEVIKTKFNIEMEYGFKMYLYVIKNFIYVIETNSFNPQTNNHIISDVHECFEALNEFLIQESINSENIIQMIENLLNTIYLSKNIYFKYGLDFFSLESSIKRLIEKVNKKPIQTKIYITLLKYTGINLRNIQGGGQTDKEKYLDLLELTIEYSEYSVIVSNLNIELMIEVLNTVITHKSSYGFNFIDKKLIEKMIKKIRNLIETIKAENPEVFKVKENSNYNSNYENSSLYDVCINYNDNQNNDLNAENFLRLIQINEFFLNTVEWLKKLIEKQSIENIVC